MARPPRERIELSAGERAELERIARAQRRPWHDVQRARIMLYAAEGETDVEIAARLDTSTGIVGRGRRRFHEERLECSATERAVRARCLPPEQIAEVKAIASSISSRFWRMERSARSSPDECRSHRPHRPSRRSEPGGVRGKLVLMTAATA